MKRISYRDYQNSMGKLIDVDDELSFKIDHPSNAINIPYERLLMNHSKYLQKNVPYYIICKKGVHSKRAVAILEYYGYNVTQVFKE